MQTCRHADMQTCRHAYMHTCIHAYMHTCIHAYMHTCIHAYMHTCIHAYMHTCIHAYMHTCIHAYIHTYIHTYMHLRLFLPESSMPGRVFNWCSCWVSARTFPHVPFLMFLLSVFWPPCKIQTPCERFVFLGTKWNCWVFQLFHHLIVAFDVGALLNLICLPEVPVRWMFLALFSFFSKSAFKQQCRNPTSSSWGLQ